MQSFSNYLSKYKNLSEFKNIEQHLNALLTYKHIAKLVHILTISLDNICSSGRGVFSGT